jgi:hypothetical protein
LQLHCPNCGGEIEQTDFFCPGCGLNLDTPLGKSELETLAQANLDDPLKENRHDRLNRLDGPAQEPKRTWGKIRNYFFIFKNLRFLNIKK